MAGRPRNLTKQDEELMEKLAVIHCSNMEIAAVLNCPSYLLSKPHYANIISKGKERGKMSLRRKMWDTAMGGNVTMQIWLSKQYLGCKEPIQISGPEKIECEVIDYKKDEINHSSST